MAGSVEEQSPRTITGIRTVEKASGRSKNFQVAKVTSVHKTLPIAAGRPVRKQSAECEK